MGESCTHLASPSVGAGHGSSGIEFKTFLTTQSLSNGRTCDGSETIPNSGYGRLFKSETRTGGLIFTLIPRKDARRKG